MHDAALIGDFEFTQISDGFEFVNQGTGRRFEFAVHEIEFVHVEGVLALAVKVAWPEKELVIWFGRMDIINERIIADEGAGFGQVEAQFAGDAVVAADNEDGPAL